MQRSTEQYSPVKHIASYYRKQQLINAYDYTIEDSTAYHRTIYAELHYTSDNTMHDTMLCCNVMQSKVYNTNDVK